MRYRTRSTGSRHHAGPVARSRTVFPLAGVAVASVSLACLSGALPAAAAAAGPSQVAIPAPAAGDKAAYATWNANGERWIYGVELRDADTGFLLAAASRKNPWTAGSLGWRGYGAAYLPDNGIRIPERASVSWWFDEAAARRRDPASRQGPHVFALRGRLSERALRAAALGERRFMLEIGIGAGMVPPVLRWHLLDREAKPPGSVIERGGDEIDWQPTFWR